VEGHVSNAAAGEEQLRLIEDFSRALEGVQGLTEVLRAASSALRVLGDLVVIAVAEPAGEVRVEAGHADPGCAAAARDLVLATMAPLRRLAALAARAGDTFGWMPMVSRSNLLLACRGETEVADLVERLKARSLMAVSLRSRSRTLGVLALARLSSDAPYGAEDLAVLQVLARRLVVGVEAAWVRGRAQETTHSHMRLEGALRKWTRVFDVAGWGAAIVNARPLTIAAANAAFARMHGYGDADDLIGRPVGQLLPADRQDEPHAWGDSAGPAGAGYETVHRRADGRTFPALVNVTRLDLEHEPDSLVVTVQDMTDLKRAEERLRRAQRMEAVGRLAGGVAHEVNNMMTIILGFSDLLGRSEQLPEPLQADVDEIRKAAARAGRITQQLLAFSRQQLLQPMDLRLNAIIEDLVPVLRLLIPANIRLETRLSPVDAMVRADRGQLEQVLINLAFNARDAMPEGGTIRIGSEARHLSGDAGQRLIGVPFAPGQYGLVSVIDTGHGMDEATLAQLFEPFFTTKPVGVGTGLGLATVYGIVKQSGGYVWAESTPGQGTTFTVGLPLIAGGPRTRPTSPEEDEPQPTPGGTVLVVEDEEGVRQLAVRILGARGYRVVEAHNGEEALAAMDHTSDGVDLVLTDVVVPDLGTGELARRVREAKGGVPILYMSGYPREEVIQRGLIAADLPFLQKPFTGDELVEQVGRVLRGSPVVGH
jgi:PAS domain S-box-containing protein